MRHAKIVATFGPANEGYENTRALIAAGVESALRTMWERWCAGLPAESFDAQVIQGDRA